MAVGEGETAGVAVKAGGHVNDSRTARRIVWLVGSALSGKGVVVNAIRVLVHEDERFDREDNGGELGVGAPDGLAARAPAIEPLTEAEDLAHGIAAHAPQPL